MKGLEAIHKPLSVAYGHEPSRASEAVAGGDMTALDGLGGVAAVAMQARTHMASDRNDRWRRLHIWLVMVSNNRLRRHLCARLGLAKKPFCACPIPFVAQEHVDTRSKLIDRATSTISARHESSILRPPSIAAQPAIDAPGSRQPPVGQLFAPSSALCGRRHHYGARRAVAQPRWPSVADCTTTARPLRSRWGASDTQKMLR